MWRALTFYQLGGVLHDLLMRRPLFSNEVRTGNRYRVAAAVLQTVPDVHSPNVPARLVTLCRNCLVKDDEVRLSRVSWKAFSMTDLPNVDDLRRRLGLKGQGIASAPPSTLTGVRAERLRVNLDEARDALVSTCRHVLHKEGFPQHGMLGVELADSRFRSTVFSFRPANAKLPDTHVHVFVALAAPVASEKEVEISVSAFLARGADHPAVSPETFESTIWRTTFEDLAADSDQLTDSLTQAFLTAYGTADDLLHALEESQDSLFPLGGF